MRIQSITERHRASSDPARPLAPRTRRGSAYVRQPAARDKLDAFAGITLWLTLTHGFAGTGLGFVLGHLTL